MEPYRRYRPNNPYKDGRDLGLFAIFFLTFILLGGVVAVLTVGSAWTMPELPQVVAVETRTSGLFGTAVVSKPNPVAGTPTPASSALLPVVGNGTPSAGRTPSPSTTPTSVAPTSTPSPTATPTQVANRLAVGNTGGVGAWLRRSPRMNDYLKAWPDTTPMEVVGPDVQAEGLVWKQVRDPQGNTGFIPAEWLVPAP